MELDIYQIDAFTDKVYCGNPACVIELESWLPDEVMLKIAKENAVAETAFFIRQDNKFRLRWFTPDIEMDLCGHATLATAHCIFSHLDHSQNTIVFSTISGDLKVRSQNDLYYMEFPSRPPKLSTLPNNIKASLNIQPKEVYKSRDYLLVYESEEQIKDIIVNQVELDKINLDPGGVVVTARGRNIDFVSRYFTPQSTILEDPVTGSSHCSLIPFWASRLNKDEFIAVQLSERTGTLFCRNLKEKVIVAGKAVTYLKGKIYID